MKRKVKAFIEWRCKNMNDFVEYVLKNFDEYTLDGAIEYLTSEYSEGFGVIQFVRFTLKEINQDDSVKLHNRLMNTYELSKSNIRKILG